MYLSSFIQLRIQYPFKVRISMKNNICFKLFTFIFVFLLFSLVCIASDVVKTPNVLTKITIYLKGKTSGS